MMAEEELAAIPQRMLREVVLRLVCPESPPSISATSGVDLREQQATAPFRSAAARRLCLSREAIDFLYRFGAQAPLLDEIAGIFLEVAETPGPADHLINKYVTPSLVFREVLYAYDVVALGASPEVMERMMVQLIRGGRWEQAEQLAKALKRRLSREEVLELVRHYTKGAMYCSESDQFWPEFAGRHLGPEATRMVRGWITERNYDAAHDLF
jgi:hypothetical protein